MSILRMTHYTYLLLLPQRSLGNNRIVVNQNGTVEQVNHHYPFGGVFGEGTATLDQSNLTYYCKEHDYLSLSSILLLKKN
ncbi:MAG: hypothetical protein LIP08_04995 [Bacteroides sp.]|nr:hypothetical protein [Bacteroides sp.]